MHFAVFVLHSSLILHCLQLKSHRRCRKNIPLLLHVQISVIDRSEICVCFLSNLIPANFSFLSSASADVAPGGKIGREGGYSNGERGGWERPATFPGFLLSSLSDNNDNNWTRAKTRKTDEPPFCGNPFLADSLLRSIASSGRRASFSHGQFSAIAEFGFY